MVRDIAIVTHSIVGGYQLLIIHVLCSIFNVIYMTPKIMYKIENC